MLSWCASGGRRWMARGWADSEQLVSVSSCVCVVGVGVKYSSSTLVSHTLFCTHFPSVGQQWGRLSWFHLLLRQWPLFSFSVMNCKLPVLSSSSPLCFRVSASQSCLFIKFAGQRIWRNSSHFRFLVGCKVTSVYTWQTSAYRELCYQYGNFKSNNGK